MDRVVDTAKQIISKLNSVGVGVWWTAHVKEKDQADLYTGANFTTLTANMTLKYFNAIKNSCHIVACGYYDRSIETQEVGKENPVTKKKKERSAIVQEVRKIKFRDDLLVADAKSRFANIVDEINLDADEFIKAIQDAIKAEQDGKVSKKTESKREIEAPKIVESSEVEVAAIKEDESDDIIDVLDDNDDESIYAEEDSVVEDKDEIVAEIKALFKELPKEAKVRIRAIKGDATDLSDLSMDKLKEIKEIVDDALSIEE